MMYGPRPATTHPDPTYWLRIKRERETKDNHECQTCGSEYNLECHHRTYARFGHEHIDDLLTLCEACHEAITQSVRNRRGTGEPCETYAFIGAYIWEHIDVVTTWLNGIPNGKPDDPLEWNDWDNIGRAVFCETGGSAAGLFLFHAWSMKSKKYNPATTDLRWDDYLKLKPKDSGINGERTLQYWYNIFYKAAA